MSSTIARKRTVCQACGEICRIRPTEIQIHAGAGGNGYWQYYVKRLCPPCQAALVDYCTGRLSSALRDLVDA